MNDMSWQEKLHALNALAECNLLMRNPNDWYINQATEIGGDGMLVGSYGNGASPEAAVLDHWYKLTNIPQGRYIVCREKHYRWDISLWREINGN